MPDVTTPYTIAVLCYLFDTRGRALLLHRRKQPNRDLYSPVGGKLETGVGESPLGCAQREIAEETGLDIPRQRLHLTGLVSEAGFNGEHWLMFLYEGLDPVDPEAIPAERMSFQEGRLEWHDPATIADLPMPATDLHVIWPLFWRHRGGFFAAHIDFAATGAEAGGGQAAGADLVPIWTLDTSLPGPTAAPHRGEDA